MFNCTGSAPLHALGGPELDPLIESALDEIGWRRVKSSNLGEAILLGRCLNSRAGMLTESAAAAKAALVEHKARIRLLLEAEIALGALNVDAASTVNFWSQTSGVEDAENATTPVETAREALGKLAPGLISLLETLQFEAQVGRRGRPIDQAARRIANAVAEIYILGRGERPTYGSREDGRGPTGLFGQTLAKILCRLGIGPVDVPYLAKQTVKDLTQERVAHLLVRRMQGPRSSLSLFDLVGKIDR